MSLSDVGGFCSLETFVLAVDDDGGGNDCDDGDDDDGDDHCGLVEGFFGGGVVCVNPFLIF